MFHKILHSLRTQEFLQVPAGRMKWSHGPHAVLGP